MTQQQNDQPEPPRTPTAAKLSLACFILVILLFIFPRLDSIYATPFALLIVILGAALTVKAKTPATAKLSLACFIIGTLFFIFPRPGWIYTAAIVFPTTLVGTVLSLVTVTQAIIHRSRPSQYILPAISLILWVSFITIFIVAASYGIRIVKRAICGQNLFDAGGAILVYANDHHGQLPDPNKWCDLLISEADFTKYYFLCKQSGAKPGQSSYALNKALIAMDFNSIPEDAVLLFEAKLTPNSWNQTAGPNDVAIENHKSGINVVFADGHIRFIKTEDIPNLNWNPKPQPPAGENNK